MRSQEVIVCKKIGNERHCFKAVINFNEEAGDIQNLTKRETSIVEAAKQGAIEILQDALKKKDKVLMKEPEKVVLKGEEKEFFFMKRYAILTEDRVKKLLAELKKVRFKKNIHSDHYGDYAYVYPDDETRTIYLCGLFWNAPKYLEKDSQPGTLIHEVSHFLGTHDIAYGWKAKPVPLGCKGIMVKGNLEKENYKDALCKAFWNADNVEYEFELTLKHKQRNYLGGKYCCCGETARYSVCDQSVPDYFHTCRVGKKWETELLVKDLCRRSEKIRGKLVQHQRTADEIKESLRKAETSRKAGLSMDFAGAAVASVGVFLAPPTLGLSALVAGGVGVAGARAALISMKIFDGRASSKKKELDDIFAECQNFLDDVKRVITFLNDTFAFQRDFGIQYRSYSWLKHIIYLKKQVESERDDLQKIYRYMEGTIQCTYLLESICKILFD
ncbi:uncharacterized protein LOC121937027 [Sceloporus undulatus]|uniref:uncharacterized protein LOC121937027 n=1 Tax=Sceloporus undulatus TaxID=8520 RepID=UPI001C4B10F5|nr:uncharacterized protein LOC121937027 [Sceloporus undulatus]